MVCCTETWCGGASSRRDPSSIPAGYASHTGYQYDSISRVAGQRELAPPSKFSNEGGFRRSVFRGIAILTILPVREFPGVIPLDTTPTASYRLRPSKDLIRRTG